jgi:hypothetical protein
MESATMALDESAMTELLAALCAGGGLDVREALWRPRNTARSLSGHRRGDRRSALAA